jgi:prolipoprotein diacylglyceryltransferase
MMIIRFGNFVNNILYGYNSPNPMRRKFRRRIFLAKNTVVKNVSSRGQDQDPRLLGYVFKFRTFDSLDAITAEK